MTTVSLIIWPVIGYVFGSISSAILVSRLFGITDPREVGSGNPGATNVLRSGNKSAALVTLLGDVLKGLIPVLLAQYLGATHGVIACTGIAAFFGHLYPIFFGFKGGKGVATAIGVFIALDLRLFAAFAITWLLVALISRYSSLSALVASGMTVITAFVIFNQPETFVYIGAIFLIVAFLFLRHKDNIQRLKTGKESKIGQKKADVIDPTSK